jgi:hypothetical protein
MAILEIILIALKIIIPNLIGIGIFAIGFVLNFREDPDSKRKGLWVMGFAIVWEFMMIYLFTQAWFL